MGKPVLRNEFASDNYAGVCPEAWQALAAANLGYASSYGDDPWTDRACAELRELFETDCEVFFVLTGTAANSLALASLCHSYHSIVCHEMSHLETDECGAPEFFSNGTKVLLVPGADGKIDLAAVEHAVHKRSDIHYPKPRVLSVTQTTELGTVYSVDELREVGELAHRLGLRLHMDGSRFANAVASLNVRPREITWQVGVDVLCLGGAKNGMALGEAVIFFNHGLAAEFDYRCKQAGQLAAKMRFLSAPWAGHAGRAAPGCATPGTPTAAPGSSPAARPRCRGCGSCIPARPTRCSWTCLLPWWRGCAGAAGTSTPSSAPAGRASCARGRPARRMWRRCLRICGRWRGSERPSLPRCQSFPIRSLSSFVNPTCYFLSLVFPLKKNACRSAIPRRQKLRCVTLLGGHDAEFLPLHDVTILQGGLTVQSGNLTVDRLVIR